MTTTPESRRRLFHGPGDPVDVAVVVVTYNSAADLPDLLADLRAAATAVTMRVVVVDNDSADDSAAIARAQPDVLAVDGGGNLGYAGGINVALRSVSPCESVLVLNPDLRIGNGAITELLGAVRADRTVGAAVPVIRDQDGAVYPSLRFEPSIGGLFGDALFGSRLWRGRPGVLSEFDYRPGSYRQPHDVDWATGAAVLLRADVVQCVGEWDERYFLYSEETDYFRRIRQAGYRVRMVPSAEVVHALGGSGASAQLETLLAVNRIRYAARYHSAAYTACLRATVVLAELVRAYNRDHRRRIGVLLDRRRWGRLPRGTRPSAPLSGTRHRGTVIVPAYNEAAVIEQTLTPLSRAAVDGYLEVIVVCNGCVDDTARRARTVPGMRVIELETGSKPRALNAGDEVATWWPRLYLDADIGIAAETVLDVLDALRAGTVLAARPAFRYGTASASPLVRRYYRARSAMRAHPDALWWAGVYGLSEAGHARFGRFPDVTGDDKFVDAQFTSAEKTVVATQPSIWYTPVTVHGLLTVLGRHRRGNVELRADGPGCRPDTGWRTARSVMATVRGPSTAVDAVAYLMLAAVVRVRSRRWAGVWERDDSSRLPRRELASGGLDRDSEA